MTNILFYILLLTILHATNSHPLLSFRSSLQNPQLLPSWTSPQNQCSFNGITCNPAGNITAITLQSIPLTLNFLSLTTSLLSIPTLQALTLHSLNLTGTLASAHCSGADQLTVLDLSFNKLTGSVADLYQFSSSCPALASFNLSGNSVGAQSFASSAAAVSKLELLDLSYNNIFSESDLKLLFSVLGQLRHLDLAGNRLVSGLPTIQNCSALQYLDLSNNELSGEISEGVFGRCSGLVYLNISSNRFAGVVPSDVTHCASLATFSLANNNFSGDFLARSLAAMPRLKVVDFAFNEFSGSLGDSVAKLSMLEVLDLSSNKLTGWIPSTLCPRPGFPLKELYLQNNMINGTIPESLSYCTNLIYLDLSLNFIGGSIPLSLGSLAKLRDLIMWQNDLEGEIPAELASIQMLENLILDNNGLTGTIPAEFSSCINLNWISLSSNHLTGSIPGWMGQLKSLAILKLGNNSFSGPIPPELGDCKSLIWLDLNNNQLNGSIPSALAKQSGKIAGGLVAGKRYVYLRNDGSAECRGSGNLLEFAGIRPEDLNRLPSRKFCNFTRVYMGSTQYTFHNNGSMLFLDLSYNQLSGEIPGELGDMYNLLIMNLGHNRLSGQIPSDFGKLRFVAVMDLSHNELEGPIPGSLAGLAMLTEIDLSNNKLNGSIPQQGQFPTFPRYRYDNNSGLCGFPLPPCGNPSLNLNGQNTRSNRREASLAGIVAMGLLFSLFCILCIVITAVECRRRQVRKENNSNSRDIYIDSRSHSGTANSNWKFTHTQTVVINLAVFDTFDKPLRNLTLGDLVEATNGFHNDAMIGSGGFGDVYKAHLKDGSVVAIKKLIHVSGQGDREFMAEMETIGKVKHRNLVPLLGYCKAGEERLLVYEYMKYGSLEDVLHNRKKTGMKLNWAARRKIAVGAARGLAFLHRNCIPHIIHRDMKSSNILLDENLEARVSDFGMARLMNTVDTHLSVSTLAGTPGYVPPEYYQSFCCTAKGDVYSYGVVLLELLTGRPSTDSSDFGDNNLVGWVKQHYKVRISDVFDPVILKEDPCVELELLQCLKIACACLDDKPMRRPTMVKVVAMLKEIQVGSTLNSKASDDAVSMDDDMVLKEGKEEKD